MVNNDDNQHRSSEKKKGSTSTRTSRQSPKGKPKMSRRKKMKYAKQITIGVSATFVIVVLALLINFVYGVIQETAAFSAQNLLSYGGVKVLDSDDNVVFQRGSDPTSYNDLPQVLVDAIVAAEDSRYFEHNGFDIPRIFTAAVRNVLGGEITSGASTITQQLIKKKYYPDEEQTMTRKIGEIYLAIQADAELSKEDILANYLNTISFGRGPQTIGIRAASSYFFDKEPSELTLPEAAYLAGSLNAPDAYDAYYHIEAATARRDTVLDLMLQHGYITEEECNLAKSTKLENLLKHPETDSSSNQYQAYIDAVIEEAVDILYSDQYSDEEIQSRKSELTNEVLEKPITIHTFMDSDLQNYLDQIQAGEIVNIPFSTDSLEMAASVQETHTGRIVGLIGGRHYAEDNTMFGLNLATSSKQQAGSSLKPLVAYGPSFEFLHWSTAASIMDEKFVDTPGAQPVRNWDNRYHGLITIENALANSYNAPAVLALKMACEEVGNDAVIDFINSLGLTVNDNTATGEQYGDFNYRYAIGGWAYGVTMVQEAGAYATVVNQGKYIEPHTINYIEYETDQSTVNYDEKIQSEATQAISEQTAFMIREIMRSYTSSSSNYWRIRATGVDCGAKSGTSTTTNNYDKGSLMAAFTPDYAISCWVGNAQSGDARLPSGASSIPGSAVQRIISQLHPDGETYSEYSSMPEGIIKGTMVKGSTDPYIAATSSMSSSYTISGYFYTDNAPENKTIEIAVDQLTSFTVESVNDKALRVAFGAYNSEYTTEDDSGEFNINRIYGRILYTTIIRDANGNELTRVSQENNEYTIDYEVTQPIRVCGIYNFSSATSVTSNEVCHDINPQAISLSTHAALSDANGNSIANGGSTTATQVRLNVTATNSDSTITVSINGGSSQSSTGSSATFNFSNLTAGQTYTITITETNPRAEAPNTTTMRFTVQQANAGNEGGNNNQNGSTDTQNQNN